MNTVMDASIGPQVGDDTAAFFDKTTISPA
jgi:hypothetical protein